MSRRDRAVDRDADEAAVRDEVDEFLAGLTQTWSSTGVDARATTRPDSPGRALEPVDDVLGLRSPVRVQNMTADYLHRPAVDDEVREVLERMRRATLDLDPDHLRVLRERREMNDDGTLDGVQLDRDARAPYVMDGVEPPWYAKSYYKVVAAVGARALDPTEDPALRRSASALAAEEAFRAGAGDAARPAPDLSDPSLAYVSVYDGVTRYTPGTTVCHPAAPDHGGGLYVSPTVEGCLRRDRDVFPAGSKLLTAPRAIARVRCWNPDRQDDPVFYGTKMAFTCVHVDEILPYPTTWGVGIRGAGDVTWNAAEGDAATRRSGGSLRESLVGDARASAEFIPSVFVPTRAEVDDGHAAAAAEMFAGAGAPRSPAEGLRRVERRTRAPGEADDATLVLEARAVASAEARGERRAAERAGRLGRDAERGERNAASLIRAQAATVALEEEVREMERRLDRARFGAGMAVNRSAEVS